MKSRSIAVITWRSMRAVRCLRSVAAPRSISSASSSPSGRRCLHATTHTARISRHSRQRHFTFKQRTPPPVSNSREQENYFVLKEPHPKNSDLFLDRNGYCSPKPHPIKACTFARTSANSSADTLPLRLAFRTRQSTLLIWSDSTTLGTAAEIGTSKG